MKNINIFLTSIVLTLSSAVFAKDFNYKVVENDQIGIIMLSLGHRKLWSGRGKVNQFKKSRGLRIPRKIRPGMTLKISEDDILFKDNVNTSGDNITFIKKIKSLSEFDQHAGAKAVVAENKPEPIAPDLTEGAEAADEPTQNFDLYIGLGGFIADNKEQDTTLNTSTFTGLQPMLQIKAIYSTENLGSFSADLLTKKIIDDKYSFPVNIDYRLQYVPKWNINENIKLALSHSTLRHSYVGKNAAVETKYELSSNFVGLGIVIPKEEFWFELYVEKAYNGETETASLAQKADNGFRLDTELVYPIAKDWRILPGVNYYHLKNDDTQYSLSVLETRLVIAHEFNF